MPSDRVHGTPRGVALSRRWEVVLARDFAARWARVGCWRGGGGGGAEEGFRSPRACLTHTPLRRPRVLKMQRSAGEGRMTGCT